jgi:hypothetical protein
MPAPDETGWEQIDPEGVWCTYQCPLPADSALAAAKGPEAEAAASTLGAVVSTQKKYFCAGGDDICDESGKRDSDEGLKRAGATGFARTRARETQTRGSNRWIRLVTSLHLARRLAVIAKLVLAPHPRRSKPNSAPVLSRMFPYQT